MLAASNQRLGDSLPVPSVQALVASSVDGSGKIPERYIQPEAEADPVVVAVDGNVNIELPVIDLGRLLDPQLCHQESAKLEHACEHWGFFQLVNHGIPQEIIERMKADIKDFFKLPLDQKMKTAQKPGSHEGYGQVFVVSEEQKLDWGDMLLNITHPVATRDMGFWPTNPPTFRDSLDRYSWELKKVARCLYGLLAKILGLDREIMFDLFGDEPQRVKFNYYPPCPQANKVFGLSPHTDATGLTLLLQVNEVQGLQIRKEGKWFPVQPLPDAFIVNIGDILEILSNGKFRSIEHRAMINTEKERLSIAAFHSPRSDITVGPLPEVVKGGKVKYRTSSYVDYMKAYYTAKLDGRCLLERTKLDNLSSLSSVHKDNRSFFA